MLGIVNTIGGNPQRQHALIMKLQTDIVRYRKKLVDIDVKITAIATTHLSHIPGASETPYEAAQRVMADRPRFEWFSDRPHCPFAETSISEAMITAASKARMRVGPDLVFLGETLPNPADLPPSARVMEWHRDLVAASSLSEGVADLSHFCAAPQQISAPRTPKS